MKRPLIELATIALLLISVPFISLQAQNLPEVGDMDDLYLFNNSGIKYAFIPQVSDGDGNVETITIAVSSDNTSLVSVDEVIYDKTNTFALIKLNVTGINSSATLSLDITDSDGTVNKSFTVTVGPYTNTGALFEIHDIVFWQEVIPLTGVAVFDTISPTGECPYDGIDFNSLDITVNAVKDDFFTALFKGFIVPKVSGSYKFTVFCQSDAGLWLSTDSDINNAVPVAVDSDKYGDHGTEDPTDQRKVVSAPIDLVAGEIYAFYSTQWVVHTTNGGILWEGPGIDRDYIPNEYLFAGYDIEKPSTVTGLTLDIKGVNDAQFSWDEATDNNEVAGYYIYLDGIRINEETHEDLNIFIFELSPETNYSIVITSVDEVGNESAPSAPVTFSTYPTDAGNPSPPTAAALVNQSGLALEISWSGATDNETTVNAYNVYLDDVLYNIAGPLYASSIVVIGLSPETEYNFSFEAIDAAGNISDKSAVFPFSTSAFNPMGNNLGVKAGRFSFDLNPYSYTHGIGINANFKNGDVFNTAHADMLDELKPGAIRWGALTANPLNFSDYIGTGKDVTIAKFMNLCNNYGAYTVFCSGVKNSTDWMTDEQTFTNFLEYIAGPAGTTYGDMRIAEGFTESLLENSTGLIFEFGNEVWGGNSHSAEIGEDYTSYGQWCREIAVLMKASQYYDEEKIKLVYSGRNPNPSHSYGLNQKVISGDQGEVEYLAFSGYLGGNLNYDPAIPVGDSELDYFKNGLERVKDNLEGLDFYAKKTIEGNGGFKPSYLYESNMSTPAYNTRMGQAVTSTDYYLTAMEHGSAIPTVFHLTNGEWRITDPGDGYKRLPLFKTSSLVNNFCKGYVLHTSYETTDQIMNSEDEVIEYEPVGCHAYYIDGDYTLVLSSRDFTADHIVQIDIPDALNFNSDAEIYTVTSDGFSSRDAVIDTTETTLSDEGFITVPAYGMVFITFTGDQITMDEFPTLALYDYVHQTSIEIEAETLEITEDKERITLNAIILPENSFATKVIWELRDNEIGARVSKKFTSCDVIASGEWGGNGTVTLRVSAPDNPEVYDEVTITISGQVGIEEISNSELSVYPNPANDKFHIQLPAEDDFELSVYTSSGKLLLQEHGFSGQLGLSTDGMINGLYFLKISTEKNNWFKKLILEK